MIDDARYRAAIEAIDRANGEDPNVLEVAGPDGATVRGPKELVHAGMMTEWVLRLDPAADEAQLLAARAHHFRRWTTPRDAYPEGRAGYLRWRSAARRRHAEEVGTLLAGVGYDEAEIADVARIVRKEGLTTDPRVRTHEDALCLVFLETQLGPVARRLGAEPTVEVLVRTMSKMSDAGRARALALDLDDAERVLVEEAASRLASPDPDGATPA